MTHKKIHSDILRPGHWKQQMLLLSANIRHLWKLDREALWVKYAPCVNSTPVQNQQFCPPPALQKDYCLKI